MKKKKAAEPKTKPNRALEPANCFVVAQLVADWSSLSEAERSDIENKVLAALNSLGIKSESVWWNKPAQLPHWQLIIQTSWRDRHSRGDASRVREQAIVRAEVQAPMNGIILKGHKKVWR
jgi:hypothetical protein